MRLGQPWPLLGMKGCSPGDVDKIEEEAGPSWQQEHLDYCAPPLHGYQQGAVVSYNPHEPWRPLHSFHS
jgi:hypothetical protein